MKKMDSWLSDGKHFAISISTIVLTLAVITVVAICAKRYKEPISNVTAETEIKVEKTADIIAKETETLVMVTEETIGDALSDSIHVPKETKPPTTEALAMYVIDNGINGKERESYLGERYEEVQKWIDINYIPPQTTVSLPLEAYEPMEETIVEVTDYYPSGACLNPEDGINYYYGTLETYYNLDMSGVVDWMHDLGYQGDYWVRDDGVKMFGDYVMVAAEYDQYPKGSVVETSLGTGLVCDTGGGGYDWFDIATAW